MLIGDENYMGDIGKLTEGFLPHLECLWFRVLRDRNKCIELEFGVKLQTKHLKQYNFSLATRTGADANHFQRSLKSIFFRKYQCSFE